MAEAPGRAVAKLNGAESYILIVNTLQLNNTQR